MSAIICICYLTALTRTSKAQEDELPIEQLKVLAEAGDAEAQVTLGTAYYNGSGVAQDHAMAFNWFMKAGLQGNMPAELKLVIAYGRGDGVPQDEALAFQWGLKAAQQGNAEAESYIGDQYASGKNVPRDLKQAFAWYDKAAIQGDKDGLAHVATSYFTGNGVEKDEKKGFTYALAAVAAGDYYSAYQIAFCYFKGIFVKPNLVQAYRWALIAIQNQPKSAYNSGLADLVKKLETQLTQIQITEARALAAGYTKWKDGDIQNDSLNAEFSSKKQVILPFELDGNLIVFQMHINANLEYFVLDTGACSAIDDRFADKIGLDREDYISIGGFGPNRSLGEISNIAELAMPGLKITNARFIIMPLAIDAILGRPIAGILGSDILKNFAVNINFDDKTITLFKSDSFQIPDGWDYASPIGVHRNLPCLVGNIWNGSVKSAPAFFGIDTGNNSALNVTMAFQESNPNLAIETASPELAADVAGDRSIKRGIVAALLAGGWYLKNVPIDVEIAPSIISSNLNGGTIGNEIWKRFNFTLDYPDHVLFLKKNKEFESPFHLFSIGLDLRASGKDYSVITVEKVVPDSPGYHAGFKEGDIVKKIDDIDQGNLSLNILRSSLKTSGTHRITISRNGADMVIEFVMQP